MNLGHFEISEAFASFKIFVKKEGLVAFHNEKELVFEFAIFLKTYIEDCSLRFEYLVDKPLGCSAKKRDYLDLAVFDKDNQHCLLFEFKYKTKKCHINHVSSSAISSFPFLNQGAQDLGVYSWLHDLSRLEGVAERPSRLGLKTEIKGYYSILLTNDPSYCKKHEKSLFENFFNPKSIKKGTLSLTNNVSRFSKNYPSIKFERNYQIIRDHRYLDFLPFLFIAGVEF